MTTRWISTPCVLIFYTNIEGVQNLYNNTNCVERFQNLHFFKTILQSGCGAHLCVNVLISLLKRYLYMKINALLFDIPAGRMSELDSAHNSLTKLKNKNKN